MAIRTVRVATCVCKDNIFWEENSYEHSYWADDHSWHINVRKWDGKDDPSSGGVYYFFEVVWDEDTEEIIGGL